MSENEEMLGAGDAEDDDDLLVQPAPREVPAAASGPGQRRAPRDPVRQFLRLGWAMVAVLVVVAVLVIATLLRLTSAVNQVACIQRAQTSEIATGTSNNAYAAGLTRLAVNKCGH